MFCFKHVKKSNVSDEVAGDGGLAEMDVGILWGSGGGVYRLDEKYQWKQQLMVLGGHL